MQGRLAVPIALFAITAMIITVEKIYQQAFPADVIFLISFLSITLHPLHSPWLSGLCLTTRNTPLMQQIAGASAEAIPELQMQQGELRAPRSMWNWATATLK